MSIGYKKIFQLIDEEVSNIMDIDTYQKKRIISLCKNIYMKEASTDMARSALLQEIKNEISHVSSILNEREFT